MRSLRLYIASHCDASTRWTTAWYRHQCIYYTNHVDPQRLRPHVRIIETTKKRETEDITGWSAGAGVCLPIRATESIVRLCFYFIARRHSGSRDTDRPMGIMSVHRCGFVPKYIVYFSPYGRVIVRQNNVPGVMS